MLRLHESVGDAGLLGHRRVDHGEEGLGAHGHPGVIISVSAGHLLHAVQGRVAARVQAQPRLHPQLAPVVTGYDRDPQSKSVGVGQGGEIKEEHPGHAVGDVLVQQLAEEQPLVHVQYPTVLHDVLALHLHALVVHVDTGKEPVGEEGHLVRRSLAAPVEHPGHQGSGAGGLVLFGQGPARAQVAVAHGEDGLNLAFAHGIVPLLHDEEGGVAGGEEEPVQVGLVLHDAKKLGRSATLVLYPCGDPVGLLAHRYVSDPLHSGLHHAEVGPLEAGDGAELVAQHQDVAVGDVATLRHLFQDPAEGI